MQVEVRNLHKYFEELHAVQGIHFEIEAGQILGFVGPNGACNTTTMRMMATLDEPDSGDVLYDGISACLYPDKVRPWIGFIPDQLPTLKHLTITEYLDFYAACYGFSESERKGIVQSVLNFTELDRTAQKELSKLSKGMSQRVNLARALVHDPKVLIMDEPAAGLDPRARVQLRHLIEALAAQGKSILVSSHILTELEELCHRSIIIDGGQIVHNGTFSKKTKSQVDLRVMRVRIIGPYEDCHRFVLERPHVLKATLEPQGLEVSLSGGENICSEFLTSLIQAGFKVIEFREQSFDLEKAFLELTGGRS